MRLNIDEINVLVKNNFRNNKSWFADELGVSRNYVSLVLNGKAIDDSAKFCKAIVSYCEKHNMDWHKYIFLS